MLTDQGSESMLQTSPSSVLNRPVRNGLAWLHDKLDNKGYTKRWTSELGCSELPLTEEQVTRMGGKVALHLPFVLGAISFFHNVPEAPDDGLKLSAEVLAKIFSREITTWDHSEIRNLQTNGWANAPNENIKVVHRIKGSSSTKLATAHAGI